MKLEASGLVVTKYALNGWTIKCIDRATGEEIYYNTKLPTGEGSWASEEEAFKAIGDEDRERVLARLLPVARLRDRPQVVLKVEGLPPAVTDETLRARAHRDAVGAHGRRGRSARRTSSTCRWPATDRPRDIVAAAILKPLNAKLGQACFAVGAVAGDDVAVDLRRAAATTRRCSAARDQSAGVALQRAARSGRRRSSRIPDTLKKLMI